jgi:hypothetical protein
MRRTRRLWVLDRVFGRPTGANGRCRRRRRRGFNGRRGTGPAAALVAWVAACQVADLVAGPGRWFVGGEPELPGHWLRVENAGKTFAKWMACVAALLYFPTSIFFKTLTYITFC